MMKDIGMTFFLTICTSYLYATEATVVRGGETIALSFPTALA
jgi:hypothetical protein